MINTSKQIFSGWIGNDFQWDVRFENTFKGSSSAWDIIKPSSTPFSPDRNTVVNKWCFLFCLCVFFFFVSVKTDY